MLNKSYDPSEAESRLYDFWESNGLFNCNRVEGETFSIVIPPPNVTGNLHMGHALNNTLQDIIVRFQRMKGKNVLWQPGTDHAGIATQMLVERKLLNEDNKTRYDLGREGFIEEVWKWKNESGNKITQQLRRLGASCDWSRERFTMDEGLSAAVNKVFVQLYNEGLIYKDKRLVNWDPLLKTAISDLEVVQKESDGFLWYIKYPLLPDKKKNIVIATTRPETMFGDTAIAVHPEDKRYKNLIGKEVLIPIVNRKIKIITDNYADPEQGSGAVKITPAHDFNDFEVGKRNNLEMISIFDENAKLNNNVPKDWESLDRFEARERLLKELEKKGYLEKADEYKNALPYGDRSDVIIEPYLTDQWYVDAKKLAQPAIASVKENKTSFVPGNWSKTYFEWMENIQPWCISRQLWWGHRIPAWYTEEGEIIVAHNEEEAEEIAKKKNIDLSRIKRDEDVLDTWFSSSLWPFSTLGWPEKTEELEKFYPTNLLVTGFDIIFFWVARMMMMGLYFFKKEPFSEVYIHALVRDEKGQKMSKSKGNVVDPLILIDKYGADSLRFTLASMAAQGRDIKLSESRVEGYRNFGTKLWNAARFSEINECSLSKNFDVNGVKYSVNKWIITEFSETKKHVERNIEEYRFNDAANVIYHFVWGEFCDWYLELIKPHFINESPHVKEVRNTCAYLIDSILIILHPFMPFITEEIWSSIKEREPLITGSWDNNYPNYKDSIDVKNVSKLINIISDVRSIRAELNIPSKEFLELEVKTENFSNIFDIEDSSIFLENLAKVNKINSKEHFSKRSAIFTSDNIELALKIPNNVDLRKEFERMKKEELKIKSNIGGIQDKLKNKNFLSKAPEDVVSENKDRLEGLNENLKKIRQSISLIEKLTNNE
jgi:valyl-tRNA synthetase|tara:strand:- start:11248 stop:13899 length:2652 start_codon:yes stop_codon:yes gene_type:complete